MTASAAELCGRRTTVVARRLAAHAALPHLHKAADDGPRRVADIVNTTAVPRRDAADAARSVEG